MKNFRTLEKNKFGALDKNINAFYDDKYYLLFKCSPNVFPNIYY